MADHLSIEISGADLENLDALLRKLKKKNPELDISVEYEEDSPGRES